MRKCLHKAFTLHIRYKNRMYTGVAKGAMAPPNF